MARGGEARKYSVSLSGLDYADDLAKKMLEFSNKMEAVYKAMQPLVQAKCEDERKYEKHFKILHEKLAWYESAEGAAKGYVNSTKIKKKKKAKAAKDPEPQPAS